MPNAVVGDSLKNEIEGQIPDKEKWLEFRSYTSSDIPPVLYGDEKGNNTPEEWAEYRAKKLKENYCGIKKENIGTEVDTKGNTVYILRNKDQRIYHNILKGKIVTKEGLKISENQFYNKGPKYTNKYGDYHPGLVVKISGDYDPSLRSYHNRDGIILEVIDEYHYIVKIEPDKTIKIRDTDVKSWICSKKTDDCFSQKVECDEILQKLSEPDCFKQD